jgi:DNA-binding NtrC family response regulator
MVAIDALTEAGYAVLESPHADHAIDVLLAKAAGVHVLFSDIDMPGTMSGLVLARYARRRWPWIAVILTSGKLTPAPYEMPKNTRFLPKPYSLSHVLTHVQELATR